MKTEGRRRSNDKSATSTAVVEGGLPAVTTSTNGGNNGHPEGFDLAVVLTALRRMRDGDFSVRLPNAWAGLEGKVADCLTTSSPPMSRWQAS